MCNNLRLNLAHPNVSWIEKLNTKNHQIGVHFVVKYGIFYICEFFIFIIIFIWGIVESLSTLMILKELFYNLKKCHLCLLKNILCCKVFNNSLWWNLHIWIGSIGNLKSRHVFKWMFLATNYKKKSLGAFSYIFLL
jgi:hypothetical protein